MAGRRILYLAVLAGCLIFYGCYREWLAWVVLLGVLWLPVLSVAVSLPGMLAVRLQPDIPGSIRLGQTLRLGLKIQCKLPCPQLESGFLLQELSTGASLTLPAGKEWKPEHCGAWRITLYKCCVYDCLGLIRLPTGGKKQQTVYIEPVPVPMEEATAMRNLEPRQWKPKPGGGFGENHDLRLYRPGDSLHRIHWKLAAKTGKLIYREPMEPAEMPPVLAVHLSGTRQEQDEILGKLLWFSSLLLSRQTEHSLCCLTGSGLYHFKIQAEQELNRALRQLLCCSGAAKDAVMLRQTGGRWIRIGGVPDEA